MTRALPQATIIVTGIGLNRTDGQIEKTMTGTSNGSVYLRDRLCNRISKTENLVNRTVFNGTGEPDGFQRTGWLWAAAVCIATFTWWSMEPTPDLICYGNLSFRLLHGGAEQKRGSSSKLGGAAASGTTARP